MLWWCESRLVWIQTWKKSKSEFKKNALNACISAKPELKKTKEHRNKFNVWLYTTMCSINPESSGQIRTTMLEMQNYQPFGFKKSYQLEYKHQNYKQHACIYYTHWTTIACSHVNSNPLAYYPTSIQSFTCTFKKSEIHRIFLVYKRNINNSMPTHASIVLCTHIIYIILPFNIITCTAS